MKSLKNLLMIALLSTGLLSTTSLLAQDSKTAVQVVSITIPTIALVDIEGPTTVTLSLASTGEAGEDYIFTGDSSQWLNYTSLVSTSGTNDVSASINNLIDGIDVNITMGNAAGSGAGTRGTTTGKQTITTSATKLIDGIKSCYTGNGTNNGHQIIYGISINDLTKVKSLSGSVTVTYTITEN